MIWWLSMGLLWGYISLYNLERLNTRLDPIPLKNRIITLVTNVLIWPITLSIAIVCKLAGHEVLADFFWKRLEKLS